MFFKIPLIFPGLVAKFRFQELIKAKALLPDVLGPESIYIYIYRIL